MSHTEDRFDVVYEQKKVPPSWTVWGSAATTPSGPAPTA
ncbi:MAG: hypothetical protein JWP56_651 [Aeromicrobium sp.]|jgi:hypothetical protein|nr:hypothetical protein [Aeromicrobium sp.]